jgi:hypothetical protein
MLRFACRMRDYTMSALRFLTFCLLACAASSSFAQIRLFGPNAIIDAPASTVEFPLNFGGMIAQDGRTAFIGVAGSGSEVPGMVHVYQRGGPPNWTHRQVLELPAPYTVSGRVAVHRDLAAITGFTDGGVTFAAFVYQRSGQTWQLTHTLNAPPEHAQGYGRSLDIENDTIAITSSSGGGAVFLYKRTTDGDVVLAEEIDTPASEEVASLDGRTLLVKAPTFDFPPAPHRVIVYRLTAQGAVQRQVLVPSDPTRADGFGDAIEVGGNVAIIGAPQADRLDRFSAGTAFIFERHGGTWHEAALLGNPEDGLFFGAVVAAGGGRVLVTGPYVGDHGGNNADSRAYVYEKRQGVWSLQGALAAPRCTNNFGLDLALTRGIVLTADLTAPDPDPFMDGEAYVFRLNKPIPIPSRTCNPP